MSSQIRTAHGVHVALCLLLHLLAFFLEPVPGPVSYERQELSGERDIRLELGLFVGEVPVNCPFDLTGLLQKLQTDDVSLKTGKLAATAGSDAAPGR